ncbi:MAG TPA: glycosyltransferase family 4 protein [Chitinophagaceae bacterium]|nr:glycosyltransferase family 4 protein [Chitinophagaceae bacterium]
MYKILRREYPEYEIEVVDVLTILKSKRFFFYYFPNIYFFCREYGLQILLGQKKWKEWRTWFLATSYISIRVGRILKKKAEGKSYKFTFQTQSVFNGKIEGVPHFIYTDHTTQTNLLYPGIDPRRYMRSKRFIEKSEIKIYQDATTVFTLGSLPAYSLINQYKIENKKVVVACAGSNIESGGFTADTAKYKLKNILFVGIEWERKGGPFLLKVFQKVLEMHPDATLTIVGCTPDTHRTPNCKVIGKIPIHSLPGYFNTASVFCMPTIREPFGIVFIEAMNYRLPIIANNIGCLPDMVINNYNGYLIDNADIDEYVEKIADLLMDPGKCKIMGENGYQYAQSKFTWEHVGNIMKSNIDKWI